YSSGRSSSTRGCQLIRTSAFISQVPVSMQRFANWLFGVGTAAATFGLPLDAQSTRDSAGVLIVENARPAWGNSERLRLARKPRLAIGNSADSAYRFRQVRGVLLLADG